MQSLNVSDLVELVCGNLQFIVTPLAGLQEIASLVFSVIEGGVRNTEVAVDSILLSFQSNFGVAQDVVVSVVCNNGLLWLEAHAIYSLISHAHQYALTWLFCLRWVDGSD